MLVCPVCGNTDFEGIDARAPFRCPVTGCDGVVDPAERRTRLRTSLPRGVMDWLSQEASEDSAGDEKKQ